MPALTLVLYLAASNHQWNMRAENAGPSAAGTPGTAATILHEVNNRPWVGQAHQSNHCSKCSDDRNNDSHFIEG